MGREPSCNPVSGRPRTALISRAARRQLCRCPQKMHIFPPARHQSGKQSRHRFARQQLVTRYSPEIVPVHARQVTLLDSLAYLLARYRPARTASNVIGSISPSPNRVKRFPARNVRSRESRLPPTGQLIRHPDRDGRGDGEHDCEQEQLGSETRIGQHLELLAGEGGAGWSVAGYDLRRTGSGSGQLCLFFTPVR